MIRARRWNLEPVVPVEMMQSWAGKSLASFLALSVFTGSVVPPVYAHSHAGGSAHHDHQTAQYQTRHSHPHSHANHHHHGHGHHHHHPPAANDGRSPEQLTDTALHWHVTLFFFDFTLPGLPGSDSGSDDDGKQPSAIARLVDLYHVMPTDTEPDRWTALESSACLAADVVAARGVEPTRHPPDCDSILLCDIARRERSGVQLT